MQDGLTAQRNSSVDDFLSLVAAGDIPHQDASLLDVPFLQQQQQQQRDGMQSQDSQEAMRQLLQQSNPALANALQSRSFGNLFLNNDSNKRKLEELTGQLQQQREQGDHKNR
jgi:hypothetical protein